MDLLVSNLATVFPADYPTSYLTPHMTVTGSFPFTYPKIRINGASTQITIDLDYPADGIYEGIYTVTINLWSDGVVPCGSHTLILWLINCRGSKIDVSPL